ncbi:hypothetical protein QQG74_09100 [Micromonospora sp. FIMYZ51]|uniref:hypothetical protein n=1 Tax=Micromonospora sp. FIMYZ51 TaxID=3051832 RepID=UPI00311FA264
MTQGSSVGARDDVFAQAEAAGHHWFVLETATGRILFTDHTCRGARSWAAHVAGAPTWRIRAGLYGVGSRTGSLTITTRDEAERRQQPTNHNREV